ncbi:MAG: DUF4907 domain-containing protein [Chitinophagaceae bacterium]|nr:DUF4907 domain-containing protein [Chitinophagaceae bacterium]
MKQYSLLLLVCFIGASACATEGNIVQTENRTNSFRDTTYRITSFQNFYGYEIFINNQPVIRQKNVPGVAGNHGFVTKADAVKTAKLVIKKLKQGMMPPSVTRYELDSMKIVLPHL